MCVTVFSTVTLQAAAVPLLAQPLPSSPLPTRGNSPAIPCRPPAVKAIFNAFSLVNFNFELLAPECSVSINFEAKWCVEQR